MKKTTSWEGRKFSQRGTNMISKEKIQDKLLALWIFLSGSKEQN